MELTLLPNEPQQPRTDFWMREYDQPKDEALPTPEGFVVRKKPAELGWVVQTRSGKWMGEALTYERAVIVAWEQRESALMSNYESALTINYEQARRQVCELLVEIEKLKEKQS
jgi:hypothetical protein